MVEVSDFQDDVEFRFVISFFILLSFKSRFLRIRYEEFWKLLSFRIFRKLKTWWQEKHRRKREKVYLIIFKWNKFHFNICVLFCGKSIAMRRQIKFSDHISEKTTKMVEQINRKNVCQFNSMMFLLDLSLDCGEWLRWRKRRLRWKGKFQKYIQISYEVEWRSNKIEFSARNLSETRKSEKRNPKGNSNQKLIKHFMISCWNVISQLERKKINLFRCTFHAVCRENRLKTICSDGCEDE